MKKTFMFILVLGMGTWAGADLLFNVNGVDVPDGGSYLTEASEISTIQIVNEEAFMGSVDIGWIRFIPDSFQTVIQPLVFNENLPGDWMITEYGMDAGWYWFSVENTVPETGQTRPGPLFEIALHCTTTGYTPIEVWNSSFDTMLLSMILMEVPEPATLALLAAGGLLLRRSFRAG